MSYNKIIVTTCIGIGVGAISGITWNILIDKHKRKYKTIENNTTEDTELTKDVRPCCKCPMASFYGVTITGGVLSGALAWIYYPQ